MREIDDQMMRLALRLARRGAGRTSPNPMVGAVVARDGLVVGTGWHRAAGTDHAEVGALRRAGDRAARGTLYVTLEPCSHHGRTPPCVDLIVASGVERVVVAMQDPDPRVNGRGIRKLKEAGISVDLGVRERDARVLNEAYLTHRAHGRPFTTYKAGVSFDGRSSARDGTSRWITHEAARAQVQRMRANSDAVCVGIGTIISDDPRLLPQAIAVHTPTIRVVVDSDLDIPRGARVLDGEAQTIVYTSAATRSLKAKALMGSNVEIVSVPRDAGKTDLRMVVADLAARNVLSILLEGGASLAGGFVRRGLIDRFVYYISPKLLGAGGNSTLEGWSAGTISAAQPLHIESSRMVGEDLRVTAIPKGRS